MDENLRHAVEQANLARYRPGQSGGHYESFFLRANHPERPLAFWIRYTIFSPNGRPRDALGELWAIYFDGEKHQHVAVKREVPFDQCLFSSVQFDVRIDDARLGPGQLSGSASAAGHKISWDLDFRGDAAPVFLLPLKLYDTALPKAKSLVALPMAKFSGSLTVDGRSIELANWVGSQNHNWGSRHTDHYAWGQVCGFDGAPESFLEVATAQIKFGPVWTPPMTPLVLRHRGREHALNDLGKTVRATGKFGYFDWHFRSSNDQVTIEGNIRAPREAFVGLRYYNPPGGEKHCLNSKIASCDLRVTNRQSGKEEVLTTRHRAAFEILTDERDHGVEIRV